MHNVILICPPPPEICWIWQQFAGQPPPPYTYFCLLSVYYDGIRLCFSLIQHLAKPHSTNFTVIRVTNHDPPPPSPLSFDFWYKPTCRPQIESCQSVQRNSIQFKWFFCLNLFHQSEDRNQGCKEVDKQGLWFLYWICFVFLNHYICFLVFMFDRICFLSSLVGS